MAKLHSYGYPGLLVIASLWLAPLRAADFRPPEQVFKYTTQVSGDQVVVTWHIAKGYYLYRKRMGFESATPGVTVGAPAWPKGETHSDEYFGPQEVYRDQAEFAVPLKFASTRPGSIDLKLKLQGCADAGLCYPPSTWTAHLVLAENSLSSQQDLTTLIKSAKRSSFAAKDDFLPADQAFQFSARRKDEHTIVLDWQIAPGYYLYKDRIAVVPQGNARFGSVALPAAERKQDQYVGDTEVYHLNLQARVPVVAGGSNIVAKVTYQGCAEAGLCYNPITKTATLAVDSATAK